MARINEDSCEVSQFMTTFKQLKRRNPPADLSGVIDLRASLNAQKVTAVKATGPKVEGLNEPSDWRVFRLNKFPGAHIVSNVFSDSAHRYLIHRCLADYPVRPHISNLDGLNGTQGSADRLWQSTIDPDSSPGDRQRLDRLRWVTLGYHYDWTNKIYNKELHNDMPEDLALLSSYIMSSVLGKQQYFRAEAAIVNFYHNNSSLSGHTDHSEFDLEAPLLSISLGLPCVFMIGGRERNVEPEALYLRCGDMIIMSGQERLSYHAVPRILQRVPGIPLQSNIFQSKEETISSLQSRKLEDENLNVHNVSHYLHSSRCPSSSSNIPRGEETSVSDVSSTDHQIFPNLDQWAQPRIDWLPYADYISRSRMNINVRQMFHQGCGADDYIWPEKDYEIPDIS